MHRTTFSQHLAVLFLVTLAPLGLGAQTDARLEDLKDEALQMVEEDQRAPTTALVAHNPWPNDVDRSLLIPVTDFS